MGHPLQIDLTALTEEEFHRKRNELLNRLNIAYRMGMADAVRQIQIMLEDYQVEIERRNAEHMERLSKQQPQFKNIIDIN